MSMSAVADGSSGRLEHGRFAPGNRFGRGNPHAKRMCELRKVMLDSIEDGTIEAATRKLGELAATGDVAAIKLLFEYAIGRPVQALELTGPDGEPLGGVSLVDLQITLMTALKPHPEARQAVGQALRELLSERPGTTGDGS
jgi:hypothetical protein